jgi:hypothetical protein
LRSSGTSRRRCARTALVLLLACMLRNASPTSNIRASDSACMSQLVTAARGRRAWCRVPVQPHPRSTVGDLA